MADFEGEKYPSNWYTGVALASQNGRQSSVRTTSQASFGRINKYASEVDFGINTAEAKMFVISDGHAD